MVEEYASYLTVIVEYVPENWILHVQSYMQECHIHLKSEYFWIPQLARHNDRFLMNAAITISCGLKELQIIDYLADLF